MCSEIITRSTLTGSIGLLGRDNLDEFYKTILVVIIRGQVQGLGISISGFCCSNNCSKDSILGKIYSRAILTLVMVFLMGVPIWGQESAIFFSPPEGEQNKEIETGDDFPRPQSNDLTLPSPKSKLFQLL